MGMGMGMAPNVYTGGMGMGEFVTGAMGMPMGGATYTSYGGGYGGYGGGVTQTTTTYQVPSMWNRVSYNYGGMYSRHSPFMVPLGVSSNIAPLFMQASQIFRTFDTNFSGSLDMMEFHRAISALGWMLPFHEVQRLFMVADSDRSGRINEREFCEFWVYISCQSNPTMYARVFEY